MSKVALVLLVGCLLGTQADGRQESGQGPPTPPPSVPDNYAFLYASGRARMESWPAAQQAIPVVLITISRRGCFGTCPIYVASLRSDGAATFNGGRNAPRTGTYVGKAYFGDFARLALFVEQSGFMQLQSRYTAPGTDQETVVVSITMRDGTTKEVSNYGRFGPPNLWILERAIDAVIGDIEWKRS